MVSRHTQPRKQGEEGGILQKEAPLYACKVHARLPQVRQDHPCRQQDRGRQEGRACASTAALRSERGGVKHV
ncbi:MAG: hypothetical protein ACLUNZ_10125 [Evtepia sp.]